MNKRTKTNRIGLFFFLKQKQTTTNKKNSLTFSLTLPLIRLRSISLYFRSTCFHFNCVRVCVCMCVKVQLFLLELMYNSSIAEATVFIWKLFPFAFLDSFRFTVVLHRAPEKELVSFNFEHSFVIVPQQFGLVLFFRLFLKVPFFPLSLCRSLSFSISMCMYPCLFLEFFLR